MEETSWGNEGGNERESGDGESKIEYREPREVKTERKKERKKEGLESSCSHLGERKQRKGR